MIGSFVKRRPGQFSPAAEVELFVDVVQVHFHRALGYVQLLGDVLVAEPAHDEAGDFGLTSCKPRLGMMLRYRHQQMLEDVVVDPFSTGRHDIYAFDKIAMADAVQQQAVGVEPPVCP